MKTIKDLKQMISEPASKEWFEKHGGAKKAIAKKMVPISSTRLEAMERAYKSQGRSVPLRYKVNEAKKNLYDMGKENKGKEETINGMKKAFGKHK